MRQENYNSGKKSKIIYSISYVFISENLICLQSIFNNMRMYHLFFLYSILCCRHFDINFFNILKNEIIKTLVHTVMYKGYLKVNFRYAFTT